MDAVLADGVGLPAADFHDDPRPRDGARDGLGQLASGVGVPVLVEVFHGDGALSSSSWFMPSRKSKTRRASASSIMESAKPTWTSTYWPICTSGTCSRQTCFDTPP